GWQTLVTGFFSQCPKPAREDLGEVWGWLLGLGRLAIRLPGHSLSGTVPMEAYEAVDLMTVQGLHRVVEPLPRVTFSAPQRVVDPLGPALLVKCGQDEFLVRCGSAEPFDEALLPPQVPEVGVPVGQRGSIRASGKRLTDKPVQERATRFGGHK